MVKLNINPLVIGLWGLFFLLITSFPLNVSAETERLVDQAQLLSEDDKTYLLEQIEATHSEIEADVVVLTTRDTNGLSAREYADDYYDQHDFSEDGFLFLIDMDNRQIYLSTSGKMIRYLTDERINQTLDKAAAYLPNENYREAIDTVLTDAVIYYRRGLPNQQGNQVIQDGNSFLRIFIPAVIGVISAGAVYLAIKKEYDLKKPTYHYPYQQYGTLQLISEKDTLVRSYITTRHIPKNPPSSGSSTHTSSGGHTHGGGGRSF